MLKIRSLILLTIFAGTVYGGGPWVQQKGHGYGQVSYTFIPKYRTLYSESANDNSLRLNREVTDVTIGFYGEYGITEKLTLLAELPYKSVKTDDALFESDFSQRLLAAGDLTGVGNISLAALHNFHQKKFVVSARLKVEAATATSDSLTGLRSGVDAWGISPAVIIGASKTNLYAYADAGLRFRTNSYSTELLLGGEVGHAVFGRFWIAGVLDIRQSLNTGTANNENAEQTGLYTDNQEYFAFGIKLIADISDQIGLNVARFGASGGNLVAKSPAYTFGVYYRW